jgi:hypothetical protein
MSAANARANIVRDIISLLSNGRESDLGGPIRHAKPDRHKRKQEAPHRPAVARRLGILQPLPAAV